MVFYCLLILFAEAFTLRISAITTQKQVSYIKHFSRARSTENNQKEKAQRKVAVHLRCLK